MLQSTISVFFFFAALAMAHPGHGHGAPHPPPALVRGRDGITNATDDNSTAVITNEVVPNFVLPCNCPQPLCDSRMSAKSICLCKEAAKMGCYLASTQAGANTVGGCPKPADDACS